VRERLNALMDDTGLRVQLDRPVEELPVGERQRLEILKALFRGARILILDEPTAVLTPQEADTLFATLRTLRARGTTVLLITHKLREILALADHVTVMRQGAVVLDCPVAQTSLDGLAQAMVGREVRLGRTGAGVDGAPSAACSGSAASRRAAGRGRRCAARSSSARGACGRASVRCRADEAADHRAPATSRSARRH
jgi:simple sugar transport system ATP-binding protein